MLAAEERPRLGLHEVVVLDVAERHVRHGLRDLERFRPLEREEGRLCGAVFDLDLAVESVVLGADVGEVLLDVRGVDDEEIGRLG